MTASVPLVSPRPADDIPPLLRSGRTAGVILALLLAAYLALTSNGAAVESQQTTTSDVAGLAVVAGDLVDRINAQDGVTRVTGGYVPNVGIVLTTELDELASDGIEEWTGNVLAGERALVDMLDPDEEVIFLLDIANPQRVSRLVAVSPDNINPNGSITSREAPAVSTAPLRPVFEPLPED